MTIYCVDCGKALEFPTNPGIPIACRECFDKIKSSEETKKD